jgi:hypothetical protein
MRKSRSWDLKAFMFYDDPQHRVEMIEVLKEYGFVANYELKHRRRDGSEPVLEGILVDNTARKTAEEELRRSRESFRNLAILDNLTGLFNTRHLYAEIRRMTEHCQHSNRLSAIFIRSSTVSGMPASLMQRAMTLRSVPATMGTRLSQRSFSREMELMEPCCRSGNRRSGRGGCRTGRSGWWPN